MIYYIIHRSIFDDSQITSRVIDRPIDRLLCDVIMATHSHKFWIVDQPGKRNFSHSALSLTVMASAEEIEALRFHLALEAALKEFLDEKNSEIGLPGTAENPIVVDDEPEVHADPMEPGTPGFSCTSPCYAHSPSSPIEIFFIPGNF